jgi:hypothetical protein
VKIARQNYPDWEILVFCNDDVTKLEDLNCDLIQVPRQDTVESRNVPRNAQYRLQIGSLLLLSCSAKYCLDKGYDYIASFECDEWLVNSNMNLRLNLLKQHDIIIYRWNKRAWPSYIQRGDVDVFGDVGECFRNFKHNCEHTCERMLDLRNTNFFVVDKDDKFGYEPFLGTVHFDSKIDGHKEKYAEYYDDKNNIIKAI